MSASMGPSLLSDGDFVVRLDSACLRIASMGPSLLSDGDRIIRVQGCMVTISFNGSVASQRGRWLAIFEKKNREEGAPRARGWSRGQRAQMLPWSGTSPSHKSHA